MYAESKRARLEREKEERRQREEARMEFSAEELALATVPGADFDPSNRHFSLDELRPQPIIRKRKKVNIWFTAMYEFFESIFLHFDNLISNLYFVCISRAT